MSKREYRDYLQDISDAIDAIEHFTKGIARGQFIEDLKTPVVRKTYLRLKRRPMILALVIRFMYG